jgi:predicted DNA-binding protein
MVLTIELPDNLEAALKAQADAQGMSEAGYVRRVLERDLAVDLRHSDTSDRSTLEGAQFAAQRIRELRKGNILPPGVSIRDLINQGRA